MNCKCKSICIIKTINNILEDISFEYNSINTNLKDNKFKLSGPEKDVLSGMLQGYLRSRASIYKVAISNGLDINFSDDLNEMDDVQEMILDKCEDCSSC